MANYATLKASVQAAIAQNGTGAITGPVLQAQLLNMIGSLGADYQFAGVATPSTSPGTPDQNVMYLASAGTYENFGSAITVPPGYIGIFTYDGSWAQALLAVPAPAVTGYAECSTAAGTAAKTVSAANFALTTGAQMRVKMTNANTASSPTLNINSTGAKAIILNGAAASSSNTWAAGDVLLVYYDGTSYQAVSAEADTTPDEGSIHLATAGMVSSVLGAAVAASQRTGYAECATAAATAAKVVALSGFTLSVGGSVRIKMTNANTASSPTLNINSTGSYPLYFNGAQGSSANSWKAGETVIVYFDGTNYQSVLERITVVNDLVTGGTTDALSAEQGKVLNVKVGQIKDEIDGPIEYVPLTFTAGNVYEDGSVPTAQNQNYRRIVMPVQAGDQFRVKLYGFNNGTSGTNLPQIGYYSGDSFTIEKSLAYHEPLTVITIPAGVDHVCFVSLSENYNASYSDYSAEAMVRSSGITERISVLEDDVDNLTDAVYEEATDDMFGGHINGYFDRDGELHIITATSWLTSGKVPVKTGDIVDYKLTAVSNIPQLGVWDAEGNYTIVLAENSEISGQYVVPAGVVFLHCTTTTTSISDYFADLIYQKSKIAEANLRKLDYYFPKFIYSINQMPCRLYPYNCVNMNAKDQSVDVVVKRKLSNSIVAFLKASTGSSANDVTDGEVVNYAIGNFDNVYETPFKSTVKKINPQNPSGTQYIICLGDSLTEYLYNSGKTAADLDYGTGAWVNEFSRMLTGVGDQLPNGISSLNLTNYEIIGTRGSGTVKHEGRGGWDVNRYLTSAIYDGCPNAFYNTYTNQFSVDYYLSTNRFSGVYSSGSNLSMIIMLNWNSVYRETNESFISKYETMLDIILDEKPNCKIYIVGINCPPERIVKNYTGERIVSVAGIKKECIRIETCLDTIESHYNGSVIHVPLLPFFYPEGSYPTTESNSICPRSGETDSFYTDYVHPNTQGLAQIADIVLAAFLNNR